jgi:phosphohistidine phosphatase SixA
MPVLLVRHASAGTREEWDGDDARRPLDKRGKRQAKELVKRLEGFRIEAVLTSPYSRCLETVAPLARARMLEIDVRPELDEYHHHAEGIALVRALAGRDVVVCGHGGLELALPSSPPPPWKKGTVFVLGPELELVDEFRV